MRLNLYVTLFYLMGTMQDLCWVAGFKVEFNFMLTGVVGGVRRGVSLVNVKKTFIHLALIIV